MKKIEIIPTVMPTDYDDFVDKINRVYRFVDTVQIDVMDGKFVSSTSWPYNDVHDSHWQEFLNQDIGLPHWDTTDFEIDLMVEKQIEEAKKWIAAGVMRVIGHIEALQPNEFEDFFALRTDFGVELYLALVPTTPLEKIIPHLDRIDGVQFMGINKIGFQGQPFEESIIETIKKLRTDKPDLHISVDGGVNFETASVLVAAGADKLASGSLIFESNDPKGVIKDLKEITYSALQKDN